MEIVTNISQKTLKDAAKYKITVTGIPGKYYVEINGVQPIQRSAKYKITALKKGIAYAKRQEIAKEILNDKELKKIYYKQGIKGVKREKEIRKQMKENII